MVVFTKIQNMIKFQIETTITVRLLLLPENLTDIRCYWNKDFRNFNVPNIIYRGVVNENFFLYL